MRALFFLDSKMMHTVVPVLFIHGLIGHMHAPEIDAAFGERAIAPDLLGYGNRKAYGGEISLPAQVTYLHGVLQERGVARAHVAGHSIGGAIAMLFAHEYPDMTQSVISIEGNFTLKDAFWSAAIAAQPLAEVERALQGDRADPAAWLRRCGVVPTPERVVAASSHLEHQEAPVMQAMARSVVEITSQPHYLDEVMTVLNNGTRVHLLAGERSRRDWDVPEFVLDNAEMTLLEDTGHLVTIESPQAFARVMTRLTA